MLLYIAQGHMLQPVMEKQESAPLTEAMLFQLSCWQDSRQRSELLGILCSPAKAGEADGEATDKGGWERYQADWRNFFECMLAPVARQAAGGSPL